MTNASAAKKRERGGPAVNDRGRRITQRGAAMRGEMEPDGSGTRDSGCRTSIDVINSRKRTE